MSLLLIHDHVWRCLSSELLLILMVVRMVVCAICRRHLCEFTGLDLEMAIKFHYNEVLEGESVRIPGLPVLGAHLGSERTVPSVAIELCTQRFLSTPCGS